MKKGNQGFWVILLAVGLMAVGAACSVKLGEDFDAGFDGGDADADADGDADGTASVQFNWAIQDANSPSTTYTCEEVGAAYIQISFTTSQETYYAAWYCTGSSGSAETGKDFPAGTGTVTFELLDVDGNVITTGVDENGAAWGDVELAEGVNDFGKVEFQFVSDDVWDPTGTDATILYNWTIDDSPPTADLCTTAGVDYMTLWIWNPDTEDWWTDESILKADCTAGGIQPTDKFLAAGSYKFFGGFYKDNQPNPDILVYYDDFGDQAMDIVAQDAPNDLDVVNITTGAMQLGNLTLNLKWQDASGAFQTDCTKAGVMKMGFLLRSDGWVAAQVPLTKEQAIDCLDQLVFEGVPYDTYEFLAEGVDDGYKIMWYHICNNIVMSQADATYECDISYQTPGQ